MPTRARFTKYAVSLLLLLLVFVGSARAQGSPDVVWQGQHTGYLRYTAFSPDGQLLISGADDRTNKVWQAANGTAVRTIVQCSGVGCRGSGFGFISPDSQTLLTSGLKFWRISDGTLQRTLGIGGGNIAISPDWQFVVAASSTSNYPGNETRTTTLFRLSDGSQVWTKADGGGQVAFSPDNQTVAAVGFQGIDIWRVSDGALVSVIPGPRRLYAFSPDGQLVVTAGGGGGAFRYDDTIKFYRVSDGALVRTMSGVGVINSAAFTPDGQTLITGSWETNQDPVNGYASQTGGIRFWRIADGALLKTYDQTTGTSANAVSVSPDGQFFSYTHDSTVVVARMPSLLCTFSITPTRADFTENGGGGSVSVTAPDGCSWKAVSRVNWINITDGGTGMGNGVVSYQTNKSGNDLTGLLIIAEQTFTVHLGTPSCTYTVTSNETNFSSDGGTGTLNVSSETGCGWDTVSNADWITITRFSHAGHSINYAVAPNSGPPRNATITIAGQTVVINQDGAAPTPAPSPTPTPTSVSVGGRVAERGVGVSGVTVTLSGDANSAAQTDADGRYSFKGLAMGGSYTVIASKAGWRFSPASSTFLNITVDKAVNFEAIADSDEVPSPEPIVGFVDLGAGPPCPDCDPTPTQGAPASNQIDDSTYFVVVNYLDFLGRGPDTPGLKFWRDQVESCGTSPSCREAKRVNTSAAFFLSIEFQNTGFLVYRMYEAAYGDLAGAPVPLRRAEFIPDAQKLGGGVVVGRAGWEQQLEENKDAFAQEFVDRQRFTDAYPAGMTASDFVSKLNANTGGALSTSEREALTQELAAAGNTQQARAVTLRKVAENAEFARREFNRAFVLTQYFGYLRRNPNEGPDSDFAGYDFWLQKLDQFNGDFRRAEMVKAFISSTEYRRRFGQ